MKGFEYKILRKPLIPISSYKVAKVKNEKWTQHLEYLGLNPCFMTHVFHSFKTDRLVGWVLLSSLTKSAWIESPHISNLRFFFISSVLFPSKQLPPNFFPFFGLVSSPKKSAQPIPPGPLPAPFKGLGRESQRTRDRRSVGESFYVFLLSPRWLGFQNWCAPKRCPFLADFFSRKEWRWMVKKKPSDNIQWDSSSSFQVGLRQYDFIPPTLGWRCPADFLHEFPAEQTKTQGAAGCTFLFTLVAVNGSLHPLFSLRVANHQPTRIDNQLTVAS